MINEDYGAYWQYTIVDTWGNVVEKGKSTKSLQTFDVSIFSNGLYSIIIEYSNLKGKKKSVMRLIKK
jgi:hypothetical protein